MSDQQRKLNFDILLQDVVSDRVYHIPGAQVGAFEVSAEEATNVPATATFVIGGRSAIEDVPDNNGSPSDEPSVLIKYPEAGASFYLSHDQLRGFQKETLGRARQYGAEKLITWVLPYSGNLLQELPAAARAMLQGNNKIVDFEGPDESFGWEF